MVVIYLFCPLVSFVVFWQLFLWYVITEHISTLRLHSSYTYRMKMEDIYLGVRGQGHSHICPNTSLWCNNSKMFQPTEFILHTHRELRKAPTYFEIQHYSSAFLSNRYKSYQYFFLPVNWCYASNVLLFVMWLVLHEYKTSNTF